MNEGQQTEATTRNTNNTISAGLVNVIDWVILHLPTQRARHAGCYSDANGGEVTFCFHAGTCPQDSEEQDETALRHVPKAFSQTRYF